MPQDSPCFCVFNSGITRVHQQGQAFNTFSMDTGDPVHVLRLAQQELSQMSHLFSLVIRGHLGRILPLCLTSEQDCSGCHCSLSIAMPPMHDKKKGAVQLVKKDKDPVSKSGDKASKKWSKG